MQKTLLWAGAALLGGCAATAVPPAPIPAATVDSTSAAHAAIDAEGLMRHIKVLASDEYEGRLPGTIGEEKTVAYLTVQFKTLGLSPGNPDGRYTQDVPLVGIEGKPSLDIRIGRHSLPLSYRKDFVGTTSRFEDKVGVTDSPLVFVGYGVQAPEYGWDDFRGLDVRGKTLVMLINDPAVVDASDAASLDERMFKGRAMTYYGRWTYKYEIASKLGAAGAIIVHETGPAGYPWAVVESSWTGEQFDLAREDRNRSRVPLQAWITRDKAQELFKASGLDFEALKQAAAKPGFKAVPLKGARANFTITNAVREALSHNVVAKVEGSDPLLKDEVIVYTAHWDHLGRDTTLDGDQIYNGAIDNVSGVAGLLELAQAFQSLPVKPKRSILFLAVTAEEQGLLGSQRYASQPLYPLAKTLAMMNMDCLNVWGPARDMQVIGIGQTTLEDRLQKLAAARDVIVVADAEPEKGFYYRSDQFNFAKVGVPALYADSGSDIIGKPAGYGAAKRAEYTANDYHKPSDEVKSDWDLSGAAADMRLLFDVGYETANDAEWPQWKPGSEFKAIREASLAATQH